MSCWLQSLIDYAQKFFNVLFSFIFDLKSLGAIDYLILLIFHSNSMNYNTTSCKDFTLGRCQRKRLPIEVSKEANVFSCQAFCNQVNANTSSIIQKGLE